MVFAFQSLVPSMHRAIHAQAEGALGLLSNLSITRSRVCHLPVKAASQLQNGHLVAEG